MLSVAWILLASDGPAPPGPAPTEAEGLSSSFRAASKRVLPAVVTVRSGERTVSAQPVDAFGGAIEPRPAREPGGSGVIIDAAKGLVLTNDHVVQSVPRPVVVLHDGRERPVKQVRRDPKSDLALLVIEPGGLSQAEWGDSDALDTGDWVLAIGQPFGLSDTVTAGIVSGKGRGIGLALYEDLIQTDAAINPGNSGGPLVDLKGRVVGINTAIKTYGGGYEGVGFAVPADRARRVAGDLETIGKVRRSYIGISVRRLDGESGTRLGLPGAVVVTAVVADGPADAGGIRPGDILLTIGGRPVRGPGPLQAAIEVATPGAPLPIRVLRAGAERDVSVRPLAQPDQFGLPEPAPIATGPIEAPRPTEARPEPSTAPRRESLESRTPSRFPALGLRLAEATPELRNRHGLPEAATGLVVLGVEPGGPADQGGLEIGMLVTDAATRRVETLAGFREALARRDKARDLVIRVLRGSKAEFRVLLGVE